jgi:hypothetical protein
MLVVPPKILIHDDGSTVVEDPGSTTVEYFNPEEGVCNRYYYTAPLPVAMQLGDRLGPRSLHPSYETAGIWWAPADVVRDGWKLLRRWMKLAESGEGISCSDGFCKRIFFAGGPSKPRDEVWLAACWVMNVGGANAAPHGCTQIGIVSRTSNRGFITARYEETFCVLGPPGVVDSEMKIPCGAPVSRVGALIRTVLTAAPFNFETEIRHSSVFAVANPRPSQILNGWREQVGTRVDFEIAKADNGFPELDVSLYVELLLNKQNTLNSQDWHKADDALEANYVSAIRNRLQRSLAEACGSSVR